MKMIKLSALVDSLSLHRAEESLRCLQFKREFYITVNSQAFNSESISHRLDLLCYPLTTDQVEQTFIYLIELGILRREVDGQGLTERVRLTPMGRQVLSRWGDNWPRPGILMKLNSIFRYYY